MEVKEVLPVAQPWMGKALVRLGGEELRRWQRGEDAAEYVYDGERMRSDQGTGVYAIVRRPGAWWRL